MLKYLICFLLFTVITAKSIHPHINVQEYGKRFHPPLVRNIRSLEDELRDLPLENDSIENPISDQNGENHSKDLKSLALASTVRPESILDQFSSPAATEYMVTSTATPQLTNDHQWSAVTQSPQEDEKEDEEDDEHDEDEDDDDEDEEENDEDEDEEDEEGTTPRAHNENLNSWHFVESATEVPAYVKDAYFSAKEQIPEENLQNGTDGLKESVKSGEHEDVEEEEVQIDLSRKSENWTMDEILAKLAEMNIDDIKLVSKKGGKGKGGGGGKKLKGGGDEMTNEDIMEIIVKVAEDPKDWEQIRQLLEKIEYEGATLKKAKSRLRALARQKQIKLRQGGGKSKWTKVPSFENSVLPKDHENFSNHLEGPSGGSPYDPTMKTSVSDSMTASRIQETKTGVGSYIKVAVFPTAPVKVDGKHTKHHNHQHHRHHSEADYAIEQPVTVIGERSRFDPVEKELLEASTNQRIREIEKEKARLEAILNPTDDMEEQLKAVSKMERRLKEHWRQKQKLMQKIREKNEKVSEREEW